MGCVCVCVYVLCVCVVYVLCVCVCVFWKEELGRQLALNSRVLCTIKMPPWPHQSSAEGGIINIHAQFCIL